MAPIAAVILTIALPTAMVRATQMTTWSGEGCNSGTAVRFTGHSAECVQLNNVKSARMDSLDSGCTATIYADTSCSSNPQALRVGQCLSTNAQIRSFSWDC